MTRNRLGAALTLLLAFGPAMPALASTMPGADDTGTRLGVGIGPEGLALSLDAPVTSVFRLGASLGTGYPVFSPASFDIRGTYQLPSVGVPHLELMVIGGVIGGFGYTGLTSPAGLNGGIEAGAGAAYTFVPKLVGRLNLVYGIPFVGGYPYFAVAPASGIELGYKFSPKIEGTIGYSGRGEVLGLRFGLQ